MRSKHSSIAMFFFFLGLLALSGCYRATVQTGLTPSHIQHEVWAHSWIADLVPPAVVKAQSECENGVARVETELSFVNQLVGAATFGIYTPMTIRVTCAQANAASLSESSSVVAVDQFADYSTTMSAFSEASELAIQKQSPAYVVFESSTSE